MKNSGGSAKSERNFEYTGIQCKKRKLLKKNTERERENQQTDRAVEIGKEKRRYKESK